MGQFSMEISGHAGSVLSGNQQAVDSIYADLRLRGTNEWTQTLVKEKATNIVTTLLTSFTFEQPDAKPKT